jgi:DNA-binding beta-propeller fold protein YncE
MPAADTNSSLRTSQTIEAIIVAGVFAALIVASVWLWRTKRLNGMVARASIVIIVVLILGGYTVKSTIALNYDHPDTANELLIFVQTTPEVPLFLQRLERLSRDLRDTYKITPPPPGTSNADPANYYDLPIFVDNELGTPLGWYLRNYTDVGYACLNHDGCPDKKTLDSTTDSHGNQYVMILINKYDETAEVQQQLAANYTMHTYKFRWWFPGESSNYGLLDPKTDAKGHNDMGIWNTNWGTVWQRLTQQPYIGGLWNYIMYRELSQPLQSVDMDVYVRNDADPDFSNSDLTGGVSSSDTISGTQQVYNMTDAVQKGHRDGQFSEPRNLAGTPDGGFAVLDSGNGRVELFDATGKFISKFGSFGNADGQFGLATNNGGPTGIATDSDGNIYVADTWNFRIEKFDKTGKFITKWGNGFDTKGQADLDAQNPTGFYGPRAIAFDPQKKELYITDTGNKRVVVYDTEGKFLRQFGTVGSGPGQMYEPIGIAYRPDGKVYIVDLRNKRIQILDSNGQYLSEVHVDWTEQALGEPYLTFDAQNNLYVTDPPNASIYKYGPDNKLLTTYNSNNGAGVINPTGIMYANDGNLYVVDPKKDAVVKIKP